MICLLDFGLAAACGKWSEDHERFRDRYLCPVSTSLDRRIVPDIILCLSGHFPTTIETQPLCINDPMCEIYQISRLILLIPKFTAFD
jgi:hypothetical protein